MSKPPAPISLPKAIIKKGRPASLLWLVPLGAAALCVWFVYRDFVATGPLITIYFQKVEGLEANNTQIQYRGVQVGKVTEMTLTPDTKYAKLSVRLIGSAKKLACVGSQFWIVRPQLKVGSISGLQTIVTGQYITVDPGDGPATNVFTGLEKPPLDKEPGAVEFNIRANALDSLQDLSGVFYRGLQVGEVLNYQLTGDGNAVMVRIRVRPEYAPLVRMNSEFWNAGGIDFHFGLFKGAELSAESTQSLLGGGLAFATPPQPGIQATNGTLFELNDKPKDDWKTWQPSIPLQLPDTAPNTVGPPNSKPQL